MCRYMLTLFKGISNDIVAKIVVGLRTFYKQADELVKWNKALMRTAVSNLEQEGKYSMVLVESTRMQAVYRELYGVWH